MSYYTEFKIELTLKEDFSSKVFEALKYAFGDEDEEDYMGDFDEDSENFFLELYGSRRNIPRVFLTSRWGAMLRWSNSRFFEESGHYKIKIDAEFQNRDREIE
jgi:hypothetical protein